MKRFALGVVLALSSLAYADKPKVLDQLEGTVKGVTDGDTLTLHSAGKVMSVRLEGIDAPETAQLYGPESRTALKELVTGKDVTVQKTGVDKYGRVLGIVLVNKTVNVNAKMVEDGWAWHYKKYNTDEGLANLEVKAREAERGIWQQGRPLMTPWDYRDSAKQPATSTAKTHPQPAPKKVVIPVEDPAPAGGEDRIWVNGYTRKDGTKVKGYWRRK